MNELKTLDEVVHHFMHFVKDIMSPFIHRLKEIYYAKLTITAGDQNTLRRLNEVVERYLRVEAAVLEKIRNSDFETLFESEISEVSKITQEIKNLQLEQLDEEVELLEEQLERVHHKIHEFMKATNL